MCQGIPTRLSLRHPPCVKSSHPLAGGVGSDFQPVATEFHAAPTARAFFAGVVEMQHTLLTLANAVAIGFCE